MTHSEEQTSRGGLGLALAIAWIGAYAGARILLELEGPSYWARATIALVPIVPFIGLLLWYIRSIRLGDELERRVQLEGLAIGYPLATILLMTLGLLEIAVGLDPENWSFRHVWVFLPLFHFVGVAIAWRRYK